MDKQLNNNSVEKTEFMQLKNCQGNQHRETKVRRKKSGKMIGAADQPRYSITRTSDMLERIQNIGTALATATNRSAQHSPTEAV